MAMSAGIATAETIEAEGLLDHCLQMADRFRGHFEALMAELPIIAELRIQGMMIGLDLTVAATPVVGKCMERGLLVNATHDTVVRLLPAINVTPEEVDEGCAILADVLRELADEVSVSG